MTKTKATNTKQVNSKTNSKKTNIKDINHQTEETYNLFSYLSYPYTQTSPEHLHTIGKVFDMNPQDVTNASILEIGCASGGNIIPLALKYPKSKIVGVDISEKHISEAQNIVKSLKLTNIKFQKLDIEDIDKEFGKFDYIIVHGLLSWVTDNVRDKIFDILSQNLNKNGIGYTSYNTLPGWNILRSIREMALHHTAMLKNTKDKLIQLRAFLDFLYESLEEDKSNYASLMKQEIQNLKSKNDSHLLHEYLTENNNQFYFKDIATNAHNKGLQYLGDTSLASMFIGNLPKKTQEKLSSITNLIQTEQYMDFIRNRRFRTSLFCHQDVKLNRALKPENIKNFYIQGNNLLCDKIEKFIDTKDDNIVKFYINNSTNHHIATSDPIDKALLYSLCERRYFSSFDDIVKTANNKFENNNFSKEIAKKLENIGMNLVMQGILLISSYESLTNKADIAKPKISDFHRHQLKQSNWITSMISHSPIVLSNIEILFALECDGSKTQDEISTKLYDLITSGKNQVKKDGKVITDKKQLKSIVDENVKNIINKFESAFLFI